MLLRCKHAMRALQRRTLLNGTGAQIASTAMMMAEMGTTMRKSWSNGR